MSWLNAYLQDTDRARVLDSAGRYERAAGSRVNAPQQLLQHYTEQSEA